tara:strand:+ start:175 stop:1323 length:1149 start_codon:yes stop_codon:yes gene_type:complete
MGLSKTNKRAWQEFKYIKIPDRRLISGLLYVNVVNHNANDDEDDFIQQCNDHTAPNGSKYSDAFVDGSGNWDAFKDRGRTDMKHSFADYDCFVFHVAGGMSLSGGIMPPTAANTVYNSEADLFIAGYVDHDGEWIDDETDATGNYAKNWTKLDDNSGGNPFGDACSHFIKYHLVSRINNASGHGLNTTDGSNPLFFKSRPMHRQTYHTSTAAVVNLADPAVVSNEYVLSHGIYDDKDTQGTALTTEHFATQGAGATGFQRIESSIRTAGETAGGGSNDDGNTYYSPVDTIKIYGKHRLVFETHDHPSPGVGAVWSHSSLNAAHVQTWWDLVIDIGLRGNNPDATSAQSAVSDKAVVRPQINVSFQPFGETADFSISDSAHTS